MRSTTGLPFLLEEGMEVAFVPPVLDVPRRSRVSEIVEQGSDLLVFFDDVTDRSTAEALAGCHCLVRRSDLPEDALVAWSGIAGWRVTDPAAGFEGVVDEVIENPSQTLLQLRSDDGEAVLIPFVDEFVANVDEDAQSIELCAPAGLYDL